MKTIWLLFLVGCGVSSDRYVEKYAEAECTYSLEWLGDEVLAFNNWIDQVVDGEERTALEMCERDVVPRMLLEKQQCAVFDKSSAKQCLDDWAVQGCPDNGADPNVPEVCSQVYTSCVGDQTEE